MCGGARESSIGTARVWMVPLGCGGTSPSACAGLTGACLLLLPCVQVIAQRASAITAAGNPDDATEAELCAKILAALAPQAS